MLKRLGIVLAAVALIGAACGDDDSGDAAPTTAPVASAETTMAAASPVTTEPTAVQAAGPGSGAAQSGSLVLLAEDFQDGDADGWEIDYGWYVFGAGSEVRMASSQSAWMWWPEGEEWGTGYVLRASVRVDQGGLAVATAVGPEGRYVVHLHADGTDLLIDRPWGTFETLATGPAIGLGTWHALGFAVDGDRIRVFVDGAFLLGADVVDPLTVGSVGFGALDGSIVAFDNVYVTVLQVALPNLPPGEPPDLEPAVEAPEVEEPPEEGGEEPEGPSSSDPPDLNLRTVAFGAPYFVGGEPVEVRFEIANDGGAFDDPFQFTWEAMGSVCTVTLVPIAPGGVSSGSCEAAALPSGLHSWTAHADHDDRIAEPDEANNLRSGIIEVAAAAPTRPDLYFADGDQSTPEADAPFRLWVIVDDANGIGFNRAFTTRFLLDGQLICSVDHTGAPVQPACDMPGIAAGAHVIEVQIDPEGEIVETRDDNNVWIWEVQIEGGRPDLRFSPAPTFDPPVGQPFEVVADIVDHNESGFRGWFAVRFLVDGEQVCMVDADPVPFRARCTVPALAAGMHEFQVIIDPDEAVDETIEHNNTYTVSVPAQ